MDDNPRGQVAGIKRFMIHDGPGIRTTVFLKGCPLRCLWCSSPQTWSPSPGLIYRGGQCLRCGTCEQACAQGAIRLSAAGVVIDRHRCTLCGACVDACPASAVDLDSRSMSASEIMEVIVQDQAFYEASGGGVTFSGGEPTTQPALLRSLLRACKRADIHTALETCGMFAWDAFLQLLPFLDLVLFDVKHPDPERHRQLTGQGNEIILENLRRIVREEKLPIVVHVPLIPRHNDSQDELRELADCLLNAGARDIELLPFHTLGAHEYEEMGRAFPLAGLEAVSPMRLAEVQAYFASRGFRVIA